MSKTQTDNQQPEAPTAPSSTMTVEEGGGELDKVRNILFGAQKRNIDHHFARIEKYFNQELLSVKIAFQKRLDALEIYLKAEFEALNKQLENEKKERVAGQKKLNTQLTDLDKSNQQELDRITTQFSEDARELRNLVLDVSKKSSIALEEKAGNLTEMMRQADEELRQVKTDRFDLADLFEELSVRIRNGTDESIIE